MYNEYITSTHNAHTLDVLATVILPRKTKTTTITTQRECILFVEVHHAENAHAHLTNLGRAFWLSRYRGLCDRAFMVCPPYLKIAFPARVQLHCITSRSHPLFDPMTPHLCYNRCELMRVSILITWSGIWTAWMVLGNRVVFTWDICRLFSDKSNGEHVGCHHGVQWRQEEKIGFLQSAKLPNRFQDMVEFHLCVLLDFWLFFIHTDTSSTSKVEDIRNPTT